MQLASEIAKAYVQIRPSAEGIQGKLTNLLGGEAEAAGSSAGASFGSSLIGKVKGLIATAGLGKALASTLTSGGALQQSLGGVETMFKDSSAAVVAAAKNAYATAGMDANAYMETVTGFSASLIASLGGDTAKAAKAADQALTDMSDNANKFGTDMESIKNAYSGFAKQNYAMLDNLKLGYGGTKTEMERLLADAQKISGVKYDISNLSDVYSAIHVIQEELGVAGATAKEASTTFTGSFNAMKSAATNVLGSLSLGEDLRPSLNALGETAVVFVKDNLFPMLGNVLKGLPDVVSSAFGMAIQGANLIAGNADAIAQAGLDFVLETGKAIILATPYLAEAAFNIVTSLGSSIIHADWPTIAKDTINELRSGLDLSASEILGTDKNIVLSAFNAIITNLPKMFEGGGEMLTQIVSGIKTALPLIWASGSELVGQLLLTLAENAPDILASGFDMLVTLVSGIGTAIPELIKAGAKIGAEFWKSLTEIDWLQLGKDIVNGLIEGLAAMGGALWEAATNIARTALDAITGFLGIHSPATKVRDKAGVQVPAGLAVGIRQNADVVRQASVELAGLTTNTLESELALTLSGSTPAYKAAGNTESDRVISILAAILSAILDGNAELLAALLALQKGGLSEREFARLVKAVIA